MENFNKAIPVRKSETTKINSVDFDNLKFGTVFSDHMLACDYHSGTWQTPEIVPYAPICLDPSAKIFHYGQSVFEGMKAYKDTAGKTWLFRPLDNFRRLNISSKRLAIPQLPEKHFIEGLKTLLQVDTNWIPQSSGASLYIRPFIFASGNGFHASPADAYKFIIATAPSGAYFSGKIKVLIEQTYSRSANGGVGFAKAGGNYAGQFYPTQLAVKKGYQQVIWTDDTTHKYIEEAGAMNIFARINDTLVTAPTSDRILDGITRRSIIELAQAEGIPVEVRKITIDELVETAQDGSLKELFGAGTAAVVSSIASFGFQDTDYDLPDVTNSSYATYLKKRITDIQTNKVDDPFGWRFAVD